jgi:carbon storage regulator
VLVISRRSGESVVIGPGVSVKVSEVRGGRVRLAIEAPADVKVLRSELTRETSDGTPHRLDT